MEAQADQSHETSKKPRIQKTKKNDYVKNKHINVSVKIHHESYY